MRLPSVKLGILGAAAAVVGLGAFGSFTDSATPVPVSVQDGTVSVDLTAADGGPSVPLAFGGVVPRTSTTQVVDLVNDGSTALSSVTLATAASLLDTDATHGLQMGVQSCSVAWTATWTCAGDIRTVLAAGPLVRTVALDAPLSLAAGATDHLAVTVALPDSAGDDFKQQSSDFGLVFTAVQRDGTAR